jgi:hypothetical protein
LFKNRFKKFVQEKITRARKAEIAQTHFFEMKETRATDFYKKN